MSTTVTVILIVTVAAAALILSYLWLTRDLGRHGGKGRDRDEETAELFAKMNRPPEIATEPPPWWKDGQQDQPQMLTAPLAGAPVLHHDEFAPMQSYDDPAPAPTGILGPHVAVAVAVATTLAALRGTRKARAGAQRAEAEARRLRDENRRLKDERDYPELVGPGFPDWRTGQFAAADLALVQAAERVADGDAEMVRAAMEQAGEVA